MTVETQAVALTAPSSSHPISFFHRICLHSEYRFRTRTLATSSPRLSPKGCGAAARLLSY